MKLLIGGSPCTHWSIAQTKNRETEPSGIGWELFETYLIALDRFDPDYFLYENNKSMSAAIRQEITKRLGVEPICINSALVSAQNRQRLYWTNIPGVQQPEDRGILLRDILETGVVPHEMGYTLQPSRFGIASGPVCVNSKSGRKDIPNVQPSLSDRIYSVNGKATAVTAGFHPNIAEPVRIGTIESDARNQTEPDSKQYRVYSPDGKSVTLCGQGGGVGAKTGLYATPVRVCTMSVHQGDRIYSTEGKSCTVTAIGGGVGGHTGGLYAVPHDGKTASVYEVRNGLITIKGKQYPIKLADGFYSIRKLTVTECKRLQTVPDSYVFPVSDTQAYKMLGNGWTVDVIAHILSYCPGITEEPLDVLSMYDGMACGHIALDKLGAKIARYRATEIDKYATRTACHNFPDIEQLGDAFQVRFWA